MLFVENLLSLISPRNNLSQKGEVKEFLNDVLSVDFSGDDDDDVVFSKEGETEREQEVEKKERGLWGSTFTIVFACRIFLEKYSVFLDFYVISLNNKSGIYLP